MKLNLISTKEIIDFEKEIGIELVVNERKIKQGSDLKRLYVSFENSDVMSNGFLIGKYGDGNTIDEALKDYCKKVSNCLIAYIPSTKIRREIQFPKLIHTKLLGK